IDRTLLLAHSVFQISKRRGIVEWVNIAGDQLGERADTGASDRIFRQQRRLRMRFIEGFNDGKRLDQHLVFRSNKKPHAHLRINRSKSRQLIVTAVLDQVNRQRLVADALEIKGDAHAICRGRTEKGIKLHISPVALSCSTASAMSSAERRVICAKAR